MKRSQFNFPGRIHQILHSSDGQLMCVHCIERPMQFIYLIDLPSGNQVRKLNIPLEERSLSLRAVDSTHFVASSFSQENNPDLIDILVYEWSDSKPTFEYPEVRLLEIDLYKAIIKHPRIEGQTLELNLNEGNQMSIDHTDDQHKFDLEIKHPRFYAENSPYFEWFQKVLSPTKLNIMTGCEHMLWKKHHWISVYAGKQSVSNHLFMLDEKGEIMESFLLASELKGIGKDTFFALQNRFIFVSENTHLHVLTF